MGKNEFAALSRRGRRISGKHLNLSFLRVPSIASSAFGFVVGKKVAASSTTRNRLRRRGYEALRAHWESIPHPVLAAFYAKSGAGTVSYDALQEEVASLIGRM